MEISSLFTANGVVAKESFSTTPPGVSRLGLRAFRIAHMKS
jgi:hypothetical protein